jgi:hypothetical protein
MTVYTNAHSNMELPGQEPREDAEDDQEETSSNAAGNWQTKSSRKGG